MMAPKNAAFDSPLTTPNSAKDKNDTMNATNHYYIQWTREFRVSKEINEVYLFETKVCRNKTA